MSPDPSHAPGGARRRWIGHAVDDLFVLDGAGHRWAGIEGLRGWAVGMVFWVHFLSFYRARSYGLGSGAAVGILNMLSAGHIGVDLFFVISGFLITDLIVRRSLPVPTFLVRRVARLFPAHLAVLAFLLALAVALGAPGYTAAQVSANLVFIQVFLAQVPAINFVTWSMGYEWLFYLAVVATVPLVARSSPRLRPAWFAILAFVVLATQWIAPAKAVSLSIVWPDTWRFLGFFWGAALGWLVRRPHAWALAAPWANTVSVITIPVVMSIRWWLGNSGTHGPVAYDLTYLVLDGSFAAIVLAALVPGSWIHSLFSRRPLRVLGAMSYSVYLTHATIGLALANQLLGHVSGPARAGVHFLLGWSVTLAASTILFWACERPYLRRSRGHKAAATATSAQRVQPA